VQLFVQQARKVRSSFALTADNAADVAAVCRRLDGLPLAIELGAAKSKVLSPRALLARLDQALDIAASGSQRPGRHKTLRDTVAWSYDLLTPRLQGFFNRLGVLAGGADLDAISAVATTDEDPDSADPFGLVAELVDSSLVTVTETPEGEPRISMLETVRAFARDQLTATGELDAVRERHAHHYLAVAEAVSPLLDADQRLEARAPLETEHDNLREALSWALRPEGATGAPADAVQIGLRLCAALSTFWVSGGYISEGRRWLERALEHAGGSDTPELAHCLQYMSVFLRLAGDLDHVQEYATGSVDMWRRLDDTHKLAGALLTLAGMELYRGQPAAARSLLEEALMVARESGDKRYVQHALADLAILEAVEGNYQRSTELNIEALDLAHELGDTVIALIARENMACTLREMGRVEEAQMQMHNLIPQALQLATSTGLTALAEDYAAILAELGDHKLAVRLLGAADARRERLETPREAWQQTEIAEPIAKARAALSTQEWNDAYQTGRNTTIEDALTQAHGADPPK
jgi:tetratricopeptide (TPR) repeat protein